jgi:hypothetical protein
MQAGLNALAKSLQLCRLHILHFPVPQRGEPIEFWLGVRMWNAWIITHRLCPSFRGSARVWGVGDGYSPATE